MPAHVHWVVRDDGSIVRWEEGKHPRASNGQFGEGGGSSPAPKAASAEASDVTEKGQKRTLANGDPLPAHIQKMGIPPAWTSVKVSHDPTAALQVQGKDSKGRLQSVYSAAHAEKQAAAKFSRVKALHEQFQDISKQNAAAQSSNNPKVKDAADCADLIMKMGVRPGSDDDTGADKKAYGATTLKGEHVVVDGDDVRLKFTGKKGVALDLVVPDAALAANLVSRAKQVGPEGKIFPNVTDKSLLDHVHTLGDGGFKTKDFRTHLGTATAANLVAKSPLPVGEKAYKKAVAEVAAAVAAKLGNTPAIALQSYINPSVFAQWRTPS